MLQIYAIPPSLYCAKLRILLRHKQLEWEELPPPGGYGSDEYKTIVPTGNLPAMRDGDVLLSDSEAIAEYLNETRNEPPMLPDNPAVRAKVRQLSRFHDTRLEPELRKMFPFLASELHDQVVFDQQSEAISVKLRQLGGLLSDFPDVDAHDLTLGHCGFPITFAWIDALTPVIELKIDWPAHVRGWIDGLEAFDAIREELASYRPVLADWVASK